MSAPAPAKIASLYRYPVKGLSPQPYQRVTLRTGQTLPNDRRYAVENGPSGFDLAAPAWLVLPPADADALLSRQRSNLREATPSGVQAWRLLRLDR